MENAISRGESAVFDLSYEALPSKYVFALEGQMIQGRRVRLWPVFALFVLATIALPDRAIAQDGDLYYDYGCNAWISGQGVYVGVDIEIWDDYDSMWASNWNEGWDWASTDAYGSMPARFEQQYGNCAANYWVDFGPMQMAQVSGTAVESSFSGNWEWVGHDEWSTAFPAAGPEELNFNVNAFIADEYLCGPFSCDEIFEGDNRNWGGGSSRIKITGAIVNTAARSGTWASGPSRIVGQTVNYEAETSLNGGHLTAGARADTERGEPMKIDWATASDDRLSCGGVAKYPPQDQKVRTTVFCTMAANNPLVTGSPDIETDFWLEIYFGKGEAAWRLNGCRGLFPHREALVQGEFAYQAGRQSNVWWLLAPCGADNFNVTGVAR
jgi:hypothetical protein